MIKEMYKNRRLKNPAGKPRLLRNSE